MQRRTFLRLGLGSAAAAATSGLGWIDPARAEPLPGLFAHGVASGDPLPDRVMLWTRVTPSPEATPGSGLGAPTEVRWEVGDETFATIVREGTVVTDAANDHIVKVDVDGLAPATAYFYRFRALGESSVTGRSRTAPAAGDDPGDLRIGVASCSNWEGGYFSAYRHLAARDDLDFVLHLGDYVYEYGAGGYGPGAGFGRVHEPDVEMTTLEHYRRRHALYKTDADLRGLHMKYPWVTMWDDHETTNDAWADGAENHQPGEGDFPTRKAAARQAYFEWMPIRPQSDAEPYRSWRGLRWGALADLFVIDERTYRSQPVGSLFVTSPAVADPDRTMLGQEQLAWLEDGLSTSTTTWRIVGTPVMFAPFIILDQPDLPLVAPAVQGLLETLNVSPPVAINGDQWDGYRAEQARLVALLGGLRDVVFLTGDIHSSWAAEIPADPGSYLPAVGGVSVAVEYVGPAITSDSLEAEFENAGLPPETIPIVSTLPTTVDSWFKYLDAARHGYFVFDVNGQRAQADYFYISDRTDPDAGLEAGPAWRTPIGSNRVVRASSRLGDRLSRVATVRSAPDAGAEVRSAGSDEALPATGGGGVLVAGGLAAAAALVLRRAGAEDGA
ncbi:MAG: alkaline phosphatase D family protein [Acidimicrobiales bacterium]